MKRLNKRNFGILGGSFDPPHVGHLKISEIAKKKYKLKNIFWAKTKKNPFKKTYKYNLNKRIILSKRLVSKKKYIKIKCYEDKIKSNKTINLINFFKKKYFNDQLFFIIGADNLVNFHKWYKWREICKSCKILVFDRNGYKKKSLNSTAFKKMGKKTFDFVRFKKVNISSSKLREF